MNLIAYRLKYCLLSLCCIISNLLCAQSDSPLKISRFELHSATATGVNGGYQLTGLQLRFFNRLKWEVGVRNAFFTRPPLEGRAGAPSQPLIGYYTGVQMQLDRNIATKGVTVYFKAQAEQANNFFVADSTVTNGTTTAVEYDQQPTTINLTGGVLVIVPITKWLGIKGELGLASEKRDSKGTFELNDRLKGGYLGVGIAIKFRSRFDLVAPAYTRLK